MLKQTKFRSKTNNKSKPTTKQSHHHHHKTRRTATKRSFHRSTTPSPKSPQEVYDEGVKSGILRQDPRQRGTIVELDRLYQSVIRLPPNYRQKFKDIEASLEPPPKQKTPGELIQGLFGKFLGGKRDHHHHGSSSGQDSELGSAHIIAKKKLELMKQNKLSNVKGMYIHGGVGCGKTMMMDMFFDQLPPHIPKVRKHFHTFMLEVHAKLHAIRQESKRTGIPQTDPLIKIANEMCDKEGLVLCLDEFQVTDVADAMILKELFNGAFAAGGIVVSTSNRKPDDLYKNGINRDSFLPFIDILKERCEIVSMDDMVDYRTLVAQEEGLIHSPLDEKTKDVMDAIYKKLSFGAETQNYQDLPQNGITLNVAMGRTIKVDTCVPSRVARLEFTELCDKALGAADYLAVAKEFPCLLLENIPILYAEDSMQLRRFITLLDVLYEHRTKVYMSTETSLDRLFQPTVFKSKKDQKVPGSAPTDDEEAKKHLDAVLKKDEVFASARALSRLTEMTSTTYLSGQFHQQGSKDTKSAVM